VARILLIADAGVPSGFGTVSHAIFERLVRDYHHEVHVLAINWQGDVPDTPMRLYLPTQKDSQDYMGMSRYVELVAKLLPDLIFFINDPAAVLNSLTNNRFDAEGALWRGIQTGDTPYKPPILAYMPIDGYDSPKSWDLLVPRVKRIAMTHFGQQAMPEAPVIWHGVDHSIFKPQNKKDAKKALGFDPDRFLVLRVDKNSTRKNYPDTWRALRPLMHKYPDMDAHFHCLPRAADGNDLMAFAWNDEDIRDRLTFSPSLTGHTGWDVKHLATLYAAADLFVSTSWGEGFGLTLLEAMACGTPVIATDCSAITEVVGDGGILIPPKGRIATPMGQDQCLPDVEAFTAAIDHFRQSSGLRKTLRANTLVQAAKFSWDEAARRMNVEITKALEPVNEIPALVT
jgi:glycosyltransferase involved in cell wall biosynthesis